MAQHIEVPGMGTVEFPDGMSDADMSAAIRKSMPSSAPIPSNLSVAGNASSKLVASIPDAVLNTPTHIYNLAKAGFGTAATALGHPELAPNMTEPPNLANRAMTSMGFIKPENEPQTQGQRLLDASVQGVGGMALSPANTAKQLATNLITGGVSGLASQGTKEATDNNALALSAGLLGIPGVNKAVSYGQSKVQQLENLKKVNAPRDQTASNARAAGYVLSPSETNPTGLNNALEGIAGKLSTRQLASQENQPISNALVRKAVDLPEDMPLTSDLMQNIRKKAYQEGYLPIAESGSFSPGKLYKQDLAALKDKYQGAARSFPAAVNDDISNLIDSLKVKKFDAGDAIKMAQILRDEASTAFRSGDTAMGQAKKGASQAIEKQIERGLEGMGKEGGILLQNFRDARMQMAKTHTIEDAIKEGGGNVVSNKLAAALQKGKPLSGELKTIAETANIFPKNMQSPEAMGAVPGISPLDVLSGTGLGVLGSIMTGNPSGAVMGAAPAVRPLIRNLLLSDFYQKKMGTPSYNASTIQKLLSQGESQPQNAPLNSALIGALLANHELRIK